MDRWMAGSRNLFVTVFLCSHEHVLLRKAQGTGKFPGSVTQTTEAAISRMSRKAIGRSHLIHKQFERRLR